MTASDEFKQELQKDNLTIENLSNALKTALSEVIELEITTWVVPADGSNPTGEALPGHRMRTRLNIVDGDIDNEVGSDFLNSGPYSELKAFHMTQVQQSREIVQDNLESIQQLFGILVTNLKHLSRTSRLGLPRPSQSLPVANSSGVNDAAIP